MTALIDRAIALNPSFVRGWSQSAMRRLWAGQLDLAIEHAETALLLSPRARVGTPFLAIGAARFLNRRFDEAVPKLRLAVQDDAGFRRIVSATPGHRELYLSGLRLAARRARRGPDGGSKIDCRREYRHAF